MDLTKMTAKQIAKEYRAHYAYHMATYGNGGDAAAMMKSADWLRKLKAAYQIAMEAP